MDILGLVPGAVSPLGLLNDHEFRAKFWLDRSFLDPPGLIGIHPNDNTAIVWLKTGSSEHPARTRYAGLAHTQDSLCCR